MNNFRYDQVGDFDGLSYNSNEPIDVQIKRDMQEQKRKYDNQTPEEKEMRREILNAVMQASIPASFTRLRPEQINEDKSVDCEK